MGGTFHGQTQLALVVLFLRELIQLLRCTVHTRLLLKCGKNSSNDVETSSLLVSMFIVLSRSSNIYLVFIAYLND